MDLQTIKSNLIQGVYLSFDVFMSDLDLIVQNSVEVNGASHYRTKNTQRIKAYFAERIDHFLTLDVPGPNPNKGQGDATSS